MRVEGWEIYSTDDGNAKPYFYNTSTETTQWDIPPELVGNEQVMSLMDVDEAYEEKEDALSHDKSDAVMRDDDEMLSYHPPQEDGSSATRLEHATALEEGEVESDSEEVGMHEEEGQYGQHHDDWGEAKDEETGQVYFFNQRDGSTTWDKPEGFVSRLLGEEEGRAAEEEMAPEPGREAEGGEQDMLELEEGEVEEEVVDMEEDEADAGERPAEALAWGWQAKARWSPCAEEESGGRAAIGGGEGSFGVAAGDSAEMGGGERALVSGAGAAMTTKEYEEMMLRQKLRQLRERPRPELQELQEVEGAGRGEEGGRGSDRADRVIDAAASEEAGAAASVAVTVPGREFKEGRDGIGQGEEEERRDRREVTEAAAVRGSRGTPSKGRGSSDGGETPPPAQAPPPVSPSHREAEAAMRAAEEALAQARALLCSEDSIMDPGIVGAVRTYIKEHSRRVEAGEEVEEDVMDVDELLAGNYRGMANMALLVGKWLQELGGDGAEPDMDGQELVLEHLRGEIKGRFDVDKADALLFGRKQDMVFIDDMMGYKRWRRTLMEIFAQHNESKLLGGYCMQHLSRTGHNTEMADLVSVEDYWSVARGVVTELLAEVPWADHVHLSRLSANLKRICCSTAYLHAFSQDVLWSLESKLLARADASRDTSNISTAQSLMAANRRFRRIRQELESAAWEAAEQGIGAAGGSQGGSWYNRCRFVHRLSAWQAEAPPLNLAEEDDPMEAVEKRRRVVDMLVVLFSEGRLTDVAAATLLETYVDANILFTERQEARTGAKEIPGSTAGEEGEEDEDGNDIAQIRGPLAFLRHPRLLEVLVRAIFDPKDRLDTETRRASACQVLAVASTALEDGSVDREEADALYGGLRQASALLADEEMLRWNMCTSGMPPVLKGLLRAHPVVAMGFLHWLRVTIQDPEFHNSRQFNEVMHVFMRLLQFLVLERPLHHPAIFEALKALLTLKPTESSFNIIKMKRQALQCCVFLMSHGFVLPVVAFFHENLAEMDHALVRHFLGLTLVAAQPPYSSVFVCALASLLRETVVSKALRSSLDEAPKRALVKFIETVCEDDMEAKSNGDYKQHQDIPVSSDGPAASKSMLLDPAMRKGLRLVYSDMLKKRESDRQTYDRADKSGGGQ